MGEKAMKKIDASTALTIALICRWDFQMGLISKQAFQEHMAEIGKMWVCRLHPQLRWPCAVCGMKKPKLVTAPKEKPEQPIDLDALRKLKLSDEVTVFSADPAVLEMIHGIPLVAQARMQPRPSAQEEQPLPLPQYRGEAHYNFDVYKTIADIWGVTRREAKVKILTQAFDCREDEVADTGSGIIAAMDTVREIHNSTSMYAKAVDTLLGAITQLLS
ncbi:MAG: hypothetical protein WAU69_11050, partial [Solirubrobacteraceae bacterium]